MNCYLHPDTVAVAFCRSCGRPLCGVCARPAEGTIYCQDHVPIAAEYGGSAQAAPGDPLNPYSQPPGTPIPGPIHTSPALAFLLGWIPGVGAIYNGQYLKGLTHAIIFGLLASIISSDHSSGGEPLLGMIMTGFIFYMPFEAYHTAKKRQAGVPVDEWSSFISQNNHTSRAPVGPIVLIVVGVLFLLDTLHIVEFRDIGRFWPVILIVVGAYMLYTRVRIPSGAPRPISQPISQPLREKRPPRTARHYMGRGHEQ